MTFTIALPVADRVASHDFYRAVLETGPIQPAGGDGQPGGDGLPEPLRFELADGVALMLVPADGFAWAIGEHAVAPAGTSECVLHRPVPGREDVRAVIERARAAGGRVVTEPADQPWGYAGTFADPDGHLWMVMPEF
ncbi:VOC family protein [Dactylosporangium sp. NPDC006015]|uniref:VOC family protein n=1 Tax=Dactylosporangium sp. NPDC006015 TaxID=3154576 RepID=UPI0033BA46D8